MDHQVVGWKQMAICEKLVVWNTRWNWTWEHWREIQLMVKVGYEKDEKLKLSYLTPFTLSLKNADRRWHITWLYERRNFQDDAAGYWAALLLALRFYPFKSKSPTDCDHKYIRGIHLHDVITDTAMENEARNQLWVSSLSNVDTKTMR